MLISIIYRLFQLGCILVVLFGLAALIAQLSQEPLTGHMFGQQLVFGKNGVTAHAVQLEKELLARDSLQVVGLDTTTATAGTKLRGDLVRQQVQVLPETAAERIGLIVYDFLYYASLALSFFALYRLFRNFHFKRYFFFENARYLRICGSLLLVNAALSFGMTAFYLRGIKAAKLLLLDGSWVESARMHFPVELDGVSLSLAVCMLVLASIFKKATEIKEAHEKFA
ncbi:MAG: hypothetical protein JWQ27_2981 [Ferruginibacter sp.]|nr:hypothetical protein [Ferruginibacter sp.]